MRILIPTILLIIVFGPAATASQIDAKTVIADIKPVVDGASGDVANELLTELSAEVKELVNGHPLAPLYISIGIGGKTLTFEHRAELVESLAWAIPHLSEDQARKAQKLARSQLSVCLASDLVSPTKGTRREPYLTHQGDVASTHRDQWPPIGRVYPLWLYGHRTGDWEAVKPLWPQAKQVWQDYRGKPIQISAETGSIWMGRTTAGVIAYARLARRFGDDADVRVATEDLQRLLDETIAYVRSAGDRARGILEEVDQGVMYGRQGRLLYQPSKGHKARITIFMDLVPAVADALAKAEPEAIDALEKYVRVYQPTYYLAFEERQVHYGESFVELPDSVNGLYRADAWLFDLPAEELAVRADIPWCKADLYYIQKLAIASEALAASK